MSSRRSRTSAEWATFAVSCAVLLTLVALIVVQASHDRNEAAPVARRSGQVRAEAGQYFVPVEVTNEGDTTAANVQVRATLVVDGEESEGDQTIDFLAGHETENLVFSFEDAPADGELTVTVTGFSVP